MMTKVKRNEKGFTMIEMMIVLLIMTVLLLIAVPNMVKNNNLAHSKGCDATIQLLEAQAGAYEVEKQEKLDSLNSLLDEYVDTITCPNGETLVLDSETGKVVKEQ